MQSNDTRPRGRRQQRDGRRQPYNNHHGDDRAPRPAPQKKTGFWQKLIAFFTGGKKKAPAPRPSSQRERTARPLERVEVTSPKLYIGNLSYDATEGDLFELFNGVGKVQNAEVVTQKGTDQSKGFGFVTMLTIDEAKRAVETLHDRQFMGRRLKVTGSKSEGPRD